MNIESIREAHPSAGTLVRATHVRGHGRAELNKQRAFNKHADYLAREVAIRLNGGE